MERYVLTLDAGGTFLKAGIFYGTELVSGTVTSVPVNSNGSLEEVHTAYLKMLKEMNCRAEERGITLSGACVDIPGPFDYQNGISRMQHKYTAIYGVPLRPWFAEIFGEDFPVLFLHDSAAFISGAAAMSDRPDANLAGAMIGTGLGFALMENGTVLLNATGGPMISVYDRPYRDGIAEDYVSGRGIVAAYRRMTGDTATAKSIGELANAGDPRALQVYEEMGGALGEILREILKERKTEILYLGGQISRSFNIFGEPLRRALQSVETLKLITPAYDLGNIHLIGAAQYWKTGCSNIKL